jgi:hypothetical protein
MLQQGGPYCLTTTAIDCSGRTAVQLTFNRWLNTDWPPFAIDLVEVSADGEVFTPVWRKDWKITESAWSEQSYDISAVADGEPTVYVRWSYQISAAWSVFSGWNIDDIALSAAACEGSCPADVNADGVVDVLDLLAVIGDWGPCPPPCEADVNADGIVDVLDLLAVIAAWGPC